MLNAVFFSMFVMNRRLSNKESAECDGISTDTGLLPSCPAAGQGDDEAPHAVGQGSAGRQTRLWVAAGKSEGAGVGRDRVAVRIASGRRDREALSGLGSRRKNDVDLVQWGRRHRFPDTVRDGVV